MALGRSPSHSASLRGPCHPPAPVPHKGRFFSAALPHPRPFPRWGKGADGWACPTARLATTGMENLPLRAPPFPRALAYARSGKGEQTNQQSGADARLPSLPSLPSSVASGLEAAVMPSLPSSFSSRCWFRLEHDGNWAAGARLKPHDAGSSCGEAGARPGNARIILRIRIICSICQGRVVG